MNVKTIVEGTIIWGVLGLAAGYVVYREGGELWEVYTLVIGGAILGAAGGYIFRGRDGR
jgi:hypothetical protein